MTKKVEKFKYKVKVKDLPRLENFLSEMYDSYVKADLNQLSREGEKIAMAYKMVIGDLNKYNTLVLSKEKIF